MFPIQRSAGHIPGISWGTSYNGFAWAVAVATDKELDLYGQTVSTLAEIARVLGELGTDKTRLLNATVYITNMQLRGEMHRAWCEWIGDDPQRWPQRACVGVDLYQKALVEIVMIAACE